MVNPTEAKRLATEQWEVLQKRSKFKVRADASNSYYYYLYRKDKAIFAVMCHLSVVFRIMQRQRRIEATNGGWAMLGLTAGVVIEGYTGKGILLQVRCSMTNPKNCVNWVFLTKQGWCLGQVADYLDAFADFLSQFLPGPPI